MRYLLMQVNVVKTFVRIAAMLFVIFAWFAGLFWLLTDSSILHQPAMLVFITGLLLLSTAAVVVGSQWWLRQQFRPRLVRHDSHDQYSYVARILRHQAALLNVRQPVLYLYDSDSVNAFLVGGIWRQQHLYLSDALVKQLNHDELEAVIAHELAHIFHRDIVINEVFFGISLACVTLIEQSVGRLLALFVNKEDRPELAKQVAIVMSYGGLLLPLWLMMLLYSRRSEYRADALASQLVGNQQFLFLLHKLKDSGQDHFFSMEGPQLLLRRFFTSHPSLHHRITALETRQQA